MSEQAGPYGRVEADGTVYVITAAGERAVGQVPDVSADEALAFYTRRFDALSLEVDLLARRIRSEMATAPHASVPLRDAMRMLGTFVPATVWSWFAPTVASPAP